jgi:excisionase family DNA binding protein
MTSSRDARAMTVVAAFVIGVDARARRRGETIRPDIVEAAEFLRQRAIAASFEKVSAYGHEASRATRKGASWCTSSAVAEAAGCSPRTVLRAIHRGELPAVRRGRDHLIDSADAARWVAERKHR